MTSTVCLLQVRGEDVVQILNMLEIYALGSGERRYVDVDLARIGWVPINRTIANETIFQQKEGKSS